MLDLPPAVSPVARFWDPRTALRAGTLPPLKAMLVLPPGDMRMRLEGLRTGGRAVGVSAHRVQWHGRGLRECGTGQKRKCVYTDLLFLLSPKGFAVGRCQGMEVRPVTAYE